MQTTTWTNKITNWTWSTLNSVSTDPGSNYCYSSLNGIKTKNVYLHEMNKPNNDCSYNGVWTTPTAKIGLMYVSDYMMSLGASSLVYTGQANKATLKTGWMHLSNNAYGATTSSFLEDWGGYIPGYLMDWTISRRGYIMFTSGDKYYVWYVNSDGRVDSFPSAASLAVRPVFYLTPDVEYLSGSGDYSDPIIIEQ